MKLDWISDIFNNREIAIGIYFVFFFCWIIFKANFGISIQRLFKDFFHYKIFVPYLLAVFYTLLGVYLLSKLALWTSTQIKDTIIWCIFSIIGTLLTLTKIRENKNYCKDSVKENFKFSIIIEFITGVYTFSLPVELIVVPSLVIMGALQAISSKEEKYANVRPFLSGIIIVFGIFTLGYTIYEIIKHVHEFASLDTLRDFILSPFWHFGFSLIYS